MSTFDFNGFVVKSNKFSTRNVVCMRKQPYDFLSACLRILTEICQVVMV